MSTLHLIRHGQASFAADDYDNLSELGRTQACLLGVYLTGTLLEQGRNLDALYCGPLRRQRDTATHVVAAAREADHPCPDAVIVDELREYPAEAVIRHLLPDLLGNPAHRDLHEWLARHNTEATGDPLRNQRAFQRIFEVAMGRWIRDEVDLPGTESFGAFTSRVRRGLRHIMDEQGRKKNVAVITSAGPVAATLQLALGLSDALTLKMSWVVANSSITELHYRQAPPNTTADDAADPELTLTTFNGTPHLLRRDLITYR